MFNHLLRYQGTRCSCRSFTSYTVDSSGRRTLGSQGMLRIDIPYYDENRTPDPT